MTEVNGILIPATPGSCYHAVLCSLAETKDQFILWSRIYERTEKYIIQYGGYEAWDKFKGKNKVKPYYHRIKDNVHTLTRSGTDCYGYRLHERGMAIYFFKDGAILLTGGKFKKSKGNYNVHFSDGRKLQVRYRGTTMTSREYKRFVDAGYINLSGKILDHQAIREFRAKAATKIKEKVSVQSFTEKIKIVVTLDDDYDQNTATRLLLLGLTVTGSRENEIEGTIDIAKVDDVRLDQDVLGVEVAALTV